MKSVFVETYYQLKCPYCWHSWQLKSLKDVSDCPSCHRPIQVDYLDHEKPILFKDPLPELGVTGCRITTPPLEEDALVDEIRSHSFFRHYPNIISWYLPNSNRWSVKIHGLDGKLQYVLLYSLDPEETDRYYLSFYGDGTGYVKGSSLDDCVDKLGD